MKRTSTIIVISLFIGLLAFASGQTLQANFQASQKLNKVKQVKISAKTITALPADKKYVIDLTRGGTIYEFDPSGGQIDFSRIVIRTAKSNQEIKPWMEKTFSSTALTGLDQGLSIGNVADFRKLRGVKLKPGKPTTSTNFQCDRNQCTCNSWLDCDDLLGTSLCAGRMTFPGGAGGTGVCSRIE